MPEFPIDRKTRALVRGNYRPIQIAPEPGLNYVVPPDSPRPETNTRINRAAKPGARPNRIGLTIAQLLDAVRNQKEQASEQQTETVSTGKRRPRGGVAGRVRAMQQAKESTNQLNPGD